MNRAGRREQHMENYVSGRRNDSTRSAKRDLLFHPHTQQPNCLQKPLTDSRARVSLQLAEMPHLKRPSGLLRGLGGGVWAFWGFFCETSCWCSTFCYLNPPSFFVRSLGAKHHAVLFPFEVILPPGSAVTRQSAHHAELHRIFASTKE